MIDHNKYEQLLKRIVEIKQEGANLRDEISKNPTLHKVIEAKLEKIESELLVCGEEFVRLAGLKNAFEDYQKKLNQH